MTRTRIERTELLSEREIECLQAILDSDGDLNKAADSLFISKATLITHKSEVFSLWKVNNIVAALKRGLLNGTLELR